MVCISSSEAWKKEEEAISERNVRLILEAAKASLRSLRHTPPLSHSLSLSPSVSPFSLALSLYPTVPVYFCTDLMCEEGRNLDRLSANGKHSRSQNADTEHHTRRPLSFLLPERNSLIGFAKIHRMWGQTADQRKGAGEKKSVRRRDGVREREIERETGGLICWWKNRRERWGGTPVLTSTACYSFLSHSVCLSAAPWIMQEWDYVSGIYILVQI